MAYRLDNTPPPKPEDMLYKFQVRNGAIVDIAFPCYYLDVLQAHDSHYHDFMGWPAPNYPGQACQFVTGLSENAGEYEVVDFTDPHPIDLTSDYEGYTEAYVVLDKEISGLTVSAWIDEVNTNVIYMRIEAAIDFFEDKPQEVRFTLFAHAPEHTEDEITVKEKISEVIRAKIAILPGNITDPNV